MQRFLNEQNEKRLINIPVGYQALIEIYSLNTVPHYRRSYVSTHGRGEISVENHQEVHIYPKNYSIKDKKDPFRHLEFAIKYDGINLEILEAVFNKLEIKEVEDFVKQSPTSKYARIIWFLYEFLINSTLNVPDAKRLPYCDLLNPEIYFTTKGIKSPRQRINNNLLGTRDFCPLIRRTKILTDHIAKQYDKKAIAMAKRYDPKIIERAAHYLYTKETLSSYEIEREKPSPERMTRFINLLHKAPNIETLTREQLVELQNIIVDPRFREPSYRIQQNYIGESINYYIQKIHYIPPKPEDVETLMAGLLDTLERAKQSDEVHPVLLAAAIAFGFVYIHPFEDGNGRIHRFLIHYILSKENFTPQGIIFPVSAVMLQNRQDYDKVLEIFSKPIMQLITQYYLSPEGVLTVKPTTLQYYKYIDYTKAAEYLFDCIEKTLYEHFEKEIEFLIQYDKTKREIQEVIDMPDKMIDLFIKFVTQNNGKIEEQKKEKYFYKLSKDEVEELEGIVNRHMLN